MNKLRKPQPSTNTSNTTAMSRTMQLAVTSAPSQGVGLDNVLQRKSAQFSALLAATPRTKVEQYWAARALVAETLLSAHDQHQAELAEMRQIEERKREREIGSILHAKDQRQKRLERLMVICLMVLLGFVGWLVKIIPGDAKGSASKPAHFTIPILSPFTSVVEHETGVFGTKAVAVFVVVIGIAVYAALKHRLSQWSTR